MSWGGGASSILRIIGPEKSSLTISLFTPTFTDNFTPQLLLPLLLTISSFTPTFTDKLIFYSHYYSTACTLTFSDNFIFYSTFTDKFIFYFYYYSTAFNPTFTDNFIFLRLPSLGFHVFFRLPIFLDYPL